MRVATNRRWKDQTTGELKEDAQFHRVIAWGKLEELCSRYIKKGSKIFVEGRLQTRSWDDQTSGQKRYMTEVVAENIILLDKKGAPENTEAVTTNQAASAPKDEVPFPPPIKSPPSMWTKKRK